MIVPLLSSRRRRQGAASTRSSRHTWRPRTILEELEIRLAPATSILDLAGLRFSASQAFEIEGTTYKLFEGSFDLGYIPIGQEAFTPLLRFSIGDNALQPINIETAPNSQYIDVQSAGVELDLIAVAGNESPPLPIWNSNFGGMQFQLGQLTNSLGVSISNGQPVTVVGCDFTLSSLGLNNPDQTTTTNSQVMMQGSLQLDKIPVVGKNLTASVLGTNYVVASATGITLNGASITATIPTGKQIGGFDVSGSLTVGYTNANGQKLLQLAGGVQVSSEFPATSPKALDNAKGTLNVVVDVGASPIVVESLDISVGGQFEIGGVTVSTTAGQNVSFGYDLASAEYRISGSLNVQIGDEGDKQFSINVGDGGSPGIVFQAGRLVEFNVGVQGQFSLSKLTVQSNGLTFNYNAGNGTTEPQFEMWGDLSVIIGLPGDQSIITADLGNSNKPGLVFKSGKLDSVNIGLGNGSGFTVYGLKLSTNHANVEWQSGIFVISGDLEADFKAFKADLQLGTDPTSGLVIEDGLFRVGDAKLTIQNARLGPLTIEDLVIEWNDTPTDAVPYTLYIAADVALPNGISASGDFTLKNGAVEEVSLTVFDPDGIPIGATGLKLVELGGKVENIETPANIVVTAHMAMIYGDQFEMFGQQVNLLHIEGDITASARELILEGQVQVGAYSLDSGQTYRAVAGSGDAKLTLDWAEQLYALHIEVDGLFAIFDLTGDILFRPGKEIDFLATVNVVVPPEIPFVGGDTLGGLGAFFQHVFPQPGIGSSTTLAGWIDIKVIWDIEVGIELFVDANGNKQTFPIGKDQIDNFGRLVQPPSNQTYFYTVDLSSQVPSESTRLTFAVDWSKPQPGTTVDGVPTFTVLHTVNGTTTPIPESAFAANNIQIITDPKFATSTSKAIQIVGSSTDSYAPLVGTYQIQVSIDASGGNPFPNFATQTSATLADYPDQLKVGVTPGVPLPTFGPLAASTPFVPAVPASPSATFPVTINGNMDLALLNSGNSQLTVYLVRQGDPQKLPIKVATVSPSTATGGINWQAVVNVPIEGLYPIAYQLYAEIDDGKNAPAQTQLSQAFTPTFAVDGFVSNQLNAALSGWTVFLDYNLNGILDATEPYSLTNSGGFYCFTPTFDTATNWAPIPVNTPFNVELIFMSDDYLIDSHSTPVNVTFDGSTPINVSFTPQEKSAIQGTVFVDSGGTGNPANGQPVANATVYLDTNNNGVRDAGEVTAVTGPRGQYTFASLANGTYTVRVDVQPNVDAIAAPAGTPGTTTLGYTFGNGFTAAGPMDITSLGVFGDGAVGAVRQPLTAVLYDAVTQKVMAQLEFTPTDSGTADGGYFYKPLATPIRVYPGFSGIIAAYGFGANQRAGRAADITGKQIPWTTNSNNNRINFTNGWFSTTAGSYPSQTDTNPNPTPYAAGSFQFRTPTPVPSSHSTGSYSVTITQSNQIEAQKNFGLRAPSAITGTVGTGTQLYVETTPNQGVPIYLYSNGYVIGATTTDALGNYTLGSLDPGTYLVGQSNPSGTRQVAPPDTSLSFASTSNGIPAGYVPVDVETGNFNNDSASDIVVAVNPAPGSNQPNAILVFLKGSTTPITAVINAPAPLISVLVFPIPSQSDILYVADAAGHVSMLTSSGNGQYSVQQTTTLPTGGQVGKYLDAAAVVPLFHGVTNPFNAYLFTSPDGKTSGVYFDGSQPQVAYTWAEKAPGPLLVMNRWGINNLGAPAVFVNGPSTIPTILINIGGDVTAERLPMLPPASTGLGVVGDINLDSYLDLGVLGTDGKLTFSLQRQGGPFLPATSVQVVPAGTVIHQAALADLNADGWVDLFLVTQGSTPGVSEMQVIMNTGIGPNWFEPFGQQMTFPAVGPVSEARLATIPAVDLIGNGVLSPVVLGAGSSASSYVLQTFTNTTNLAAVAPPVAFSVGIGQTGKLNFSNIVYAKTDLTLTIPARVGSGNYTVSLQDGNVVVADSEIGRVLYEPLMGLNSLTIQTDPGRPSTLTIDLGGGAFNLAGGIHFGGPNARDIIVKGPAGGSNVEVTPRGVRLDGRNLVSWSKLQQLRIEGGPSNDLIRVSGDPGIDGTLTLVGGPGQNRYDLAATNARLVVIDDSRQSVLDFQRATLGLSIDLGLWSGQAQPIGAGGNWLTLYGAFSEVLGTRYSDRIVGNAIDNVLRGLDGDDLIDGGEGNDLLDGGLGNDLIFGRSGRSILLGGPGNDLLMAGSNRNLLIGGAGHDTLVSLPASPATPAGGSILIGGSTTLDANDNGLRAVLAEWSTVSRGLLTRIRNLKTGLGSRLRNNGWFFLNSSTVRNDGATNQIFGDPGRDWIHAGSKDRIVRPRRPRV